MLIRLADKKQIKAQKFLRERSYALALLPALEAYASTVRRIKYQLNEEHAHEQLDEINSSLELPSSLAVRVIDIHELGSAGGQLQDALASVPKLRTLLNEHEFYVRYGGIYHDQDGAEFEIDMPPAINPVVDQVIHQFESAVKAARDMFGSESAA